MAIQNYKDSGVDIEAGNSLVEEIKPLAKNTNRSGTMSGLGGFGALFDLKAAGYDDPLLVSATDGVGTKLKIAIETGIHDTVGIDLVAMCVNDLVVQGAEPLFFLDYYATGKLDIAKGRDIISGIAKGCEQAGCALIGGETAEMPGMYSGEDYDLAGFAVGAVDRNKVITGETIKEGDCILGLGSTGVHSNGFSLVRKLLETANLNFHSPCPYEEGKTIGESLLTPTRIYTKTLAPQNDELRAKGYAHITGGGLLENIPRVLPDGLCASLDMNKWTIPPVFDWLQQTGQISGTEMARTFNCGIGMVVICAQEQAETLKAHYASCGEEVYDIGTVTSALGEQVVIENMKWA